MNLDHARYFLELSKTQHILKTAKRLGISPTAISHGIAKLEQELGVTLTAKAGRNIVLTDSGIAFCRRIEKILGELAHLKEDLSQESVGAGTYKFGVTHGLWNFLFDPAARGEFERTADTTLEISSLRSAEVVQSVAQGWIDFGVCFSPLSHPEILSEALHRGRLLFVAGKHHPVFKARTHEARVRVLNESEAVGVKSFLGVENCESHPSFRAMKLKPRHRYVIDNYELMLHLLRTTQAWAFIPDLFLPRHPNLRAIELGNDSARYTVEAVWNKNRKPLPLYRKLAEKFKAALAD